MFLTRLDKEKLAERIFYSKIDLRRWTTSTPGRTRAGHQQTASFTPAISQVLYYIVHVRANNEREGYRMLRGIRATLRGLIPHFSRKFSPR